MESVVIIGSSGHAKVVIDIVEKDNRYRLVGLIDDYREIGEQTLGHAVKGRVEDLGRLMPELGITAAIVAIGDNFDRHTVAEKISSICPGIRFISAIHPAASLGSGVTIGHGSVVTAGVVINPNAVVGRFCILNTNSSLDHDSMMADFSNLAPSATVGGGATIGRFASVNIGATVTNNVEIGEHSVIGAGATVLKSIGPYSVAYGTPAAVVRTREAGEAYF